MSKKSNLTAFCTTLMSVGALLLAPSAMADEGHSSGFGEPGQAAQAKRTIQIKMQDNMFEPESVSIKAGETIRFVIKNDGELLHEFNIGTNEMHAKHQEEMMMMVEHGMLTPTGINRSSTGTSGGMSMGEMKHDDPNSVLVEPGKSAELVWHFTKPADIEFACNIPGHYESGMAGPIKFSN